MKKSINEIAETLNSALSNSDEKKLAKRKIKITLARNSLWLYCKCLAPEFYKDNRWHLKLLCDTLQALYEGRIWKPSEIVYDDFGKGLKKPKKNTEWITSVTKEEIPKDAFICKKLKINMPPRHGKSRTLILFETWCYGQNVKESVITVSYNQTTAEEFSRYVRDEISKQKMANQPDVIVCNDVFPDLRIKDDDASVTKWSLKGSHFSYMGTGMSGSVTSKGGTILVIDDQIKDSVVANNEIELDSQYQWYTDTFKSRTDAVGGEPIEIINMTRWATRDICGRIDSNIDERDEWYTLLLKVMNEETGEMLCEDIFNRARYYSQKNQMTTGIFRANYFQEPLDIKGRLYSSFLEYSQLPSKITGRFMEIDPADTGADYLCAIAYEEGCDKMAYVTDVIYNNKKVEFTIPLVAKSIINNKINKVRIESNNGGRLFAKLLRETLDKMKYLGVIIECKPTTSSMNKQARINNGSEIVQTRVLMPHNWTNKYNNFAVDVFKYVSGGKNAHDDGPDCLTRVAESLVKRTGMTQGIYKRETQPNSYNQTTSANNFRPVMRVARVIRR